MEEEYHDAILQDSIKGYIKRNRTIIPCNDERVCLCMALWSLLERFYRVKLCKNSSLLRGAVLEMNLAGSKEIARGNARTAGACEKGIY